MGADAPVSVVIPCRNCGDTLDEQLRALVEQDWPAGYEVLVVDNQSTDNTAAVVARWAETHPQVRLVQADSQAGLNYARNVGFEHAIYDCLLVCDGDDIVSAGWLGKMAAAIQEHAFVTGPLELYRLNPPWLAESRGPTLDGPATFYGVFPYASGGNMGLRRDVWSSLGRFDANVSGVEDVEFSLRAWRAGIPLHFARGAAVHYRYRERARDLWRQGKAYGAGRPLIVKHMRRLEVRRPPRIAGWRSWAWLVMNLPRIYSRPGRARWLWVAGNRWGHIVGSVRHRTICL